ncbi:MAG TPA: hypothetical protein VN772_07460 [Solirubrobacteraceae bacterium]|nr:hypothetical protein [Solirubrobacteraceae bacterium]
MSQAEDPRRVQRKRDADEVTVEDVRQLMGASTPHFALQLRNRIANLIDGLAPAHPARLEGEREIARLEALGLHGETRGEGPAEGERPLPSLELASGAGTD